MADQSYLGSLLDLILPLHDPNQVQKPDVDPSLIASAQADQASNAKADIPYIHPGDKAAVDEALSRAQDLPIAGTVAGSKLDVNFPAPPPDDEVKTAVKKAESQGAADDDEEESASTPSGVKAQSSPFGPGLSNADLAKALKQRQDAMYNAAIMKGANTASAGLGGPLAQAHNESVDALTQAVGAKAENILTQRQGVMSELKAEKEVMDNATEKDKSDPDSAASQLMQEALAGMGYKADGLSAAAIEKTFGSLAKIQEAHQALLMRQLMMQNNQNKFQYKQGMDLDKSLDTSTLRATTVAGRDAKRISDAQNIRTLLTRYGNGSADWDNVPGAQVAEAILSTVAMLSPGTPNYHTFELMIPKTYGGDAAKWAEKLSGSPEAAHQGAFLENISHLLDREEGNAKMRLENRRQAKLQAFSSMAGTNPNMIQNIGKSYENPVSNAPAQLPGGIHVSADDINAEMAKRFPNGSK